MSILTFLVFAVGQPALAKTPVQCPSTFSNFFRGIDLTAEEKIIVDEMRMAKRAIYKKRKEHHKSSPQEGWMVRYVAGDMTRSQVLRQIEGNITFNDDNNFEIKHRLAELLAGYDAQDIEKVLSNIEYTQQCFDEYYVVPEAKKRRQKIRPMAVLLSDLELSEEQSEDIKEIRRLLLEHREKRGDGFGVSSSEMARILSTDSQRQEQLMDVYEERSQQNLQFELLRANRWMDVLDSFDAKQQAQFLDNAETLEAQVDAARQP